jgi:hypothetical protein
MKGVMVVLQLSRICGRGWVRGKKFHRDESVFFPKILGAKDFPIEKTTENFMTEISSKLGDFFPEPFLGLRVM